MMKKLLPVLAVLAAALIVVSTGAFTSITAERTAEIYVADDATALLTLAPAAGANGAYADYNDAGALYLNFEDVAAAGVNVDAWTDIDNIFTITNNGTQTVYVSLEWNGSNAGNVMFDYSTTTTMASMKGSIELDVGETAIISMWIDSYGLADGDNLLETLIITATAAE